MEIKNYENILLAKSKFGNINKTTVAKLNAIGYNVDSSDFFDECDFLLDEFLFDNKIFTNEWLEDYMSTYQYLLGTILAFYFQSKDIKSKKIDLKNIEEISQVSNYKINEYLNMCFNKSNENYKRLGRRK